MEWHFSFRIPCSPRMGITPAWSIPSQASPLQTTQTTPTCFNIELSTEYLLNVVSNSRWIRLPQKTDLMIRVLPLPRKRMSSHTTSMPWGLWRRRVLKQRAEPDCTIWPHRKAKLPYRLIHSFIKYLLCTSAMQITRKITIKNENRVLLRPFLWRHNSHTMKFTLLHIQSYELTMYIA